MFDIGALELLMVVVVAIIVIGPKDMPQALRVAGRWIGKLRRTSAQFRSGFDSIVREAEMEDMEKKWQEQNARIMAETPEGEMGPLTGSEADVALPGEQPREGQPADLMAGVKPDPQAAAAKTSGKVDAADNILSDDEPMLPLDTKEKP